MIDVAKHLKTALTGIDGINTVAIGIEPNISPKDYPMIRIVPVNAVPDDSLTHYERIQFDVFVGLADKLDKDGYELIYETLESWEAEIKARISTNANAAFFWKGT
ncbi:MAG: hypothetical protein IE928_09175, partial [Gammaproteobacteria bacterium]|nr:hypothetical protein [Gammaproteobacteria bacterium]